MLAPDIVRRFAACAPGKRVRVVSAEGTFDLPMLPPQPEPELPDLLSDVSRAFIERDEQTRQALSAVAAGVQHIVARVDETSDQLSAAVRQIARDQQGAHAQTSEGLKTIAMTLAAPVRPIYDAKGRLTGAARDVVGSQQSKAN